MIYQTCCSALLELVSLETAGAERTLARPVPEAGLSLLITETGTRPWAV